MKNGIVLIIIVLMQMSCVKKSDKLLYKIEATYDSTNTNGNYVDVVVTKTDGDDDLVTLSVDGLPDYVAADIVPMNGRTPFTARIGFQLSYFAQKDLTNWKGYPITIKGKSVDKVERFTDVTVFCYPEDATTPFIGHSFKTQENCTVSGSKLNFISMLSENNKEMLLVDFYNTMFNSYSVPAIVNERERTLTIPETKIDNYTFRGNGTFYINSGNELECKIHFSRSTVSTFDTCTATLTIMD